MQTVVDRMKELRRKRGLTAQQLAEQMTRVGVPWEHGVVTKLETRRRKSLSITEWLALACVLDVPPVSLLLPVEDVDYQVTPEITLRASRVGAWIILPEPLPPQVPDQSQGSVPHPGETFARRQRHGAEWPTYLYRPELGYDDVSDFCCCCRSEALQAKVDLGPPGRDGGDRD